MAKKKKSAQNSARGYFQGSTQQQKQQQPSSATTKTTSTSVSSKAHNEIKALLELRTNDEGTKQAENITSSVVPPSDRFESRLSNIIDRLEELKFSDSQVEQVVKSLQYEITLETALDWLCLNLNTLELPALFTDIKLRETLSTVTTSESLSVLKPAVPAAGSIVVDAHKENVFVATPKPKHSEVATCASSIAGELQNQQREEEEERKKWLLQQYEYEEDGEAGMVAEEAHLSMDDELEAQLLSPEEIRLAEEEQQLRDMEADLNNDANNYMRSKHEIKQLQNEVKKMRQQVTGLRKRVQRIKAKPQQKEEHNGAAEVASNAVVEQQEDEEYGGGIFDVFGQSNDDKDVVTEPKAAPKTTQQLDCRIPKGWTGTTPQKKLEEICKKQKLHKPKYFKLPCNEGFRLSVATKKNQHVMEWEARHVDFQKDSSLKDYLATHALYATDPTLQLYSIFPPAFRDLWLSWTNKVKEEKDQVLQESNAAKQQRLDHFMSLISGLQINQTVKPTKENALQMCPKHDLNKDDAIVDDETYDWDDSITEELPVRLKITATGLGKKMQASFKQRQSTPSYQKMQAIRRSLPMESFRQTVLETVRQNSVTILCAETGAGKTTQCPQYLLEEALMDGLGDKVQILCTQPRRVAATSVAERVAEEMCEPYLGKMVGYQIRNENKRSQYTKLLFCTTGVVLRRLQDDNSLDGITHVIVDEVHERQQQTDVLLVILRQLINTKRPDLKVVLMSATMDTGLFCSFFQGAPMISVPGRTFPVSTYYLEDLLDATGHIIEEGSRYAKRENHHGEKTSLWVTTRGGEKRKEVVDLPQSFLEDGVSEMYQGYKMSTRKSMERVNEEVLNYDLIEDVLILLIGERDSNSSLVLPDGTNLSKGSVLIFFPGLGEIKSMTERLDGSRLFGDKRRFDVIPMHSTLSSQDQRRAFIPSKSGCRKIILATNIAETSVTIPDVTCVIDTGRAREVRRNKRTSTSVLATDWCSKASAKQRAGRAGRVQSGLALKLYSLQTASSVMKPASEPELRRVPLEEVCLSILACGFAKSCMDFLIQAPQPPDEESVRTALDTLYDVGAIERKAQDSANTKQSECLTPLGKHLARLPVDVRLGKMLIFGALFHCIDPILTIAASLSSQSPFSTFVSDEAVAKAKQKVFADPDSDFQTYCNVWDAYSKASATSASAGRKFCYENYLNYVAMREISDGRRQFLELLCGIGFLDRKTVVGDPKFNEHSNKEALIHAVICAGLYPNIARIDQSTYSNDYSIWHKDERIHFHKASSNAAKKRFGSSENWVVFHEKFGTPKRTSVSTTCFVHPIVLLLFGGSVVTKHVERLVIVDDWMQVGMAAQTGVILSELRKQVDLLFQKMVERADVSMMEKSDAVMIDGIINILVS